MKRASMLAVALAAWCLLISACGSGGQDVQPSATETPRSERAERDASIMQQQQEAQQAEPTAQVEVDAETTDLINFGHREGLPYTRNVVGDPEAPVLIVEYSDFQ